MIVVVWAFFFLMWFDLNVVYGFLELDLEAGGDVIAVLVG